MRYKLVSIDMLKEIEVINFIIETSREVSPSEH